MIDWRDVPSLSALRAFHAYATTGSVVEAGMRLNVSHAAISQHLRTLEEELGVQLIDRSGRAGVLTTNGVHLSEALELGFGAITRTIRAMSDTDSDRPLVVTTTPAFAARWLLPRLAQFRADYPGIDMVIDPTPEVRTLEPGGADVALRHGGGAARVGLTRQAGSVTLTVEDDGPGIPDGDIVRMLEPFTRGDPSRNRGTGGAGLGLTLARAIAEQHGGSLTLANRAASDGKVAGLTASLSLPLT
jgi:molybdenum-dependent DNA-binding transcriptional regulator ModE